MELKQLRCFLAVAEHLHFGHAAEAVFLSQPALSLQIRALEEEIQVPLFLRDRHKTQLTPAGEALIEDAQVILERSARAVQHARQATLGEVGTLHVGFISTAAALLIPPVVKEFRRRYPGVNLELRNVLTEDQIAQLLERKIDVGFLRVPINAPPEIVTKVVHSEPFVLLVPVGHRLAGRKPYTMADLRSEDFIVYTRKLAAGFHDRIMGILNASGFSPKVAQTVSEMYTLISLVAAGQGVAIAPASIQLHNTKGVAARRLPVKTDKSEIAMAYNNKNISPAASLYIRVVNEMHAANGLAGDKQAHPR